MNLFLLDPIRSKLLTCTELGERDEAVELWSKPKWGLNHYKFNFCFSFASHVDSYICIYLWIGEL